VSALKAEHDVSDICRVLDVSRSGYYKWLNGLPSVRAIRDVELVELIRAAHNASRQTYGYRRIHADLRAADVQIGVRRVRRLMREHGICGITRRLKRRIRLVEAQAPFGIVSEALPAVIAES